MSAEVIRIEIPRELDDRLEAAHQALALADNESARSPERRVAALREYLDVLGTVRSLVIASALYFAVLAAEHEVRSWLIAAERDQRRVEGGGPE